ncbi:unnamed protein product [Didymodactylos carnosus]|uniref:G-protein coupled receptors family 1 profile domain-containing protein n=1 Tax=Didymodactylos carnosus TaxID=1234261 RepID=A0A816BJX7_9BILA|nr:unnamed protein product [Didymodactylos carnosus]CAF1609238.1 unnamed protein product [Didymodactylos carnosus]CAF4335390.1 unnamed protein product [Didymodactylos carnosus]CAF4491396.1 unnamed protein product [Didymodactylos carnosus]
MPHLDDVHDNECVPSPGAYEVFYVLFHSIFYALIPPVSMVTFGLLTLFNVRRSRRQILSIEQQQNSITKRRDAQLIRMLLIQVVVFTLLITPEVIRSWYRAFTLNVSKSEEQIAIEELFEQIANLLLYTTFSITFYLFTLTSEVFRRTFIQLFKRTNTTVSLNH